MRVIRFVVPMLCLTAVSSAQILALSAVAFAEADAPEPTQVLAAARQALGGEQRLQGVKSFVASGRTRQVRGENLVPIEFEISVELPDKYVRKDEIPAQESGPTSAGFNGETLIQDPAPPKPAGRVVSLKQDFVRLTLGMFASSFISSPVTFSYAGIAEAPQGKADVLDVKGDGDFALRLFVHSDTHLPVMVSWMVGAKDKAVEHRLYYSDYRDVDGMKLPFRLRRAIAGETIEETTFDRFRINVKIDPRKFEVRK
jgi:hypothetical protein